MQHILLERNCQLAFIIIILFYLNLTYITNLQCQWGILIKRKENRNKILLSRRAHSSDDGSFACKGGLLRLGIRMGVTSLDSCSRSPVYPFPAVLTVCRETCHTLILASVPGFIPISQSLCGQSPTLPTGP